MSGQPWLIRSEIQPAFDGGFIQARFLIGGIFVVKNKTQRNSIHVLNRKLDASTTTLVVVTDENRIYRLVSNPTTTYTTDVNWEVFFIGQTSSFHPVGTWDADNDILVLQDVDALNRNGEFYFVSDAPTQRTVQYPGLFQGNTVDVVDGDLIVSVGDKWAVITSMVQWDSLNKPSVIDDYVNGIVIAHSHVISDITGLSAALDAKYDIGDTAPHNIDFASVSDTAITEVEFLRAFFYTKIQVDTILGSIVNDINTVSINLTASQIKTLFSSPVVVVPAQGANTMIQLLSMNYVHTYGSVPFNLNGLLCLSIGTTPNFINFFQTNANTFINNSSSSVTLNTPSAGGTFFISGSTTNGINTPLILRVDGANATTGDSTGKIIVKYRIINL